MREGETVQKRVADLVAALKGELAVYRRLLDLLERQQRSIVRRKVDEMTRSVSEEEALIRETAERSAIRANATALLAGACGFPEEINLEGVIAALDDKPSCLCREGGAELEQFGAELKDVLSRISEICETNQALMRYALDTTARKLEILLSPVQDSVTYGETGGRDEEESEGNIGIVDRVI